MLSIRLPVYSFYPTPLPFLSSLPFFLCIISLDDWGGGCSPVSTLAIPVLYLLLFSHFFFFLLFLFQLVLVLSFLVLVLPFFSSSSFACFCFSYSSPYFFFFLLVFKMNILLAALVGPWTLKTNFQDKKQLPLSRSANTYTVY